MAWETGKGETVLERAPQLTLSTLEGDSVPLGREPALLVFLRHLA